MTSLQLIAVAAGAVVGAVVAIAGIRQGMRRATPPALVRVNVNGRKVPVILGEPIVLGGLMGLGAAIATLLLGSAPIPRRPAIALGAVLLILWLAGAWDDRRGDERPRGFAGHLAAARRFRLTGGIVKALAGLVAGLVAGALVASGAGILETALLVALAANLINLLDRAPGRAGKVALLALLLLAVLGAASWTVLAAGAIASLAAALPSDLGEKAMLGDAGANPSGGVLGLGLAVSLPEAGRIVVIVVLLALNLASERWSFSRAIARVGFLNAFDRIGRR